MLVDSCFAPWYSALIPDSRLLTRLIDSFLAWGFVFFLFFRKPLGGVSFHIVLARNIRVSARAAAGRKEQVWQQQIFTSISRNPARHFFFFFFENKPELDIVLWHAPVKEFFVLAGSRSEDRLDGIVVVRPVLCRLCPCFMQPCGVEWDTRDGLTSGLPSQEVEHTSPRSWSLNLSICPAVSLVCLSTWHVLTTNEQSDYSIVVN